MLLGSHLYGPLKLLQMYNIYVNTLCSRFKYIRTKRIVHPYFAPVLALFPRFVEMLRVFSIILAELPCKICCSYDFIRDVFVSIEVRSNSIEFREISINYFPLSKV